MCFRLPPGLGYTAIHTNALPALQDTPYSKTLHKKETSSCEPNSNIFIHVNKTLFPVWFKQSLNLKGIELPGKLSKGCSLLLLTTLPKCTVSGNWVVGGSAVRGIFL